MITSNDFKAANSLLELSNERQASFHDFNDRKFGTYIHNCRIIFQCHTILLLFLVSLYKHTPASFVVLAPLGITPPLLPT